MPNQDVLQPHNSQSRGGRRKGHSRGDDTRQRILAVALDVFAAYGYEGTTTRHLAEMAQVNLAAIPYYFGSKDGLYRAVVAHLVGEMECRIAVAADQVARALAMGPLSRQKALTLLCLMLDAFAALIIDQRSPHRKSQVAFFARAEVEPSAALDPMREWAERRILRPCITLIGRLIDRPADEEVTLLRTLALLGQARVFCGQNGLRALGWPEVDGQRLKTIQTLLRQHTQATFRSLACTRL